MKELTHRQKEILLFIANYINNYLYPPTVREIAGNFNMSAKAAHDHITALRKKNYLTHIDNQARTLKLSAAAEEELEVDDIIEIPLVGTVAAGIPILSEENREGTIPMHYSMLKNNKTYFAVKVRGDSMIGAGINDGDIALIEKKETVHNGEIAVALIDDAVTLKRFYKKNSRIILKSENKNYKPITCFDVRILGRLSRIIRYY